MSSTIYVLLPILAQAFGFTYVHIGVLKGLKSISQAVLEMGSGWLSERIGEYRLIIVGLALSGAGYLSLSTAPSAFFIGICFLIIGAGTGLHHAPSSALIANSSLSTIRGRALGLYNASGDVGKLAFTGVISLSAGAGLAWQQISFFYGLVVILAAVAIAMATRSLLRQRRRAAWEEPEDIDQPEITGWGILNWPSYGALLIVTSIDTLVQTTVLVFVAFLMLSKGLPLPVATGATRATQQQLGSDQAK